jgi:hypothetical protein
MASVCDLDHRRPRQRNSRRLGHPVVNKLRSMNVVPHVAAKAKGSAIDGRTTRHAGYVASLRVRKRIEEAFAWVKSGAGFARTRHRGARTRHRGQAWVG